MVHVDFTLKRFPINGKLKDDCGLPFSCVVQPFAKVDHSNVDSDNALDTLSLPRCEECYAYINGYCVLHPTGWDCSLCGIYNEFKPHTAKRYNVNHAARAALPELNSNVMEVVSLDLPESEGSGEGPALQVPVVGNVVPVYIALVDTCCEDEYLELVRSALLASLEALPACALFGLITVSNQVGLHDVKGGVPVLRNVPLLGPEGLPGTPLEDVMPLDALLADVGGHKEELSRAIELLEPDASFLRTYSPASTQNSRTPPPEQASMQRTPVVKRGFGPALQAVLQYLKTRAYHVPEPEPFLSRSASPSSTTSSHPAMGPAHILGFLAGPPSLGVGSVITRSVTTAQSASTRPGSPPSAAGSKIGVLDEGRVTEDMSARLFYEQAAVAAASLQVTVDLFAVGPRPLGLQHMEPVVNSTGGALFLYPSVEDSAMPQDVYRRLSTPHARSCLLRIRTSPEFKAVRSYGRIFQDPTHENLHHALCCDSTDTYGFDFDFSSPVGFGFADANEPTIQVAFQYSLMVQESKPTFASSTDSLKDINSLPPPRFRMQRRLRVLTIRLYVAKTAGELIQSANPDVVMAMLCAKIMKVVRATMDQGTLEADSSTGSTTVARVPAWSEAVHKGRLLLQDWLIVFTADYHKHAHSDLAAQAVAEIPVDMTFPDCPSLQSIPRMVYAMLRSPLLSLMRPPSDLAAFISHLWSTLPPADLLRAMYPCLSSFQDPNTPAWPRHSLSNAALVGADAGIFLMDAYIVLICHYTESCPADIPYPPPQNSMLRKSIAQIKQERRVTPQLRIQKEGVDDTTLFHQLLLDEGEDGGEQPATGGPTHPTNNLLHFLDQIQASIQAHLRAEASTKAPAP